MYDIKADQEKNRLHVKLTGSIEEDERKSIFDSIKREVQGLSKEFDCIVDLGKFKMKPEYADWMLQIQEFLIEAGMCHMIRVGDPMYKELFEKNSPKSGYSGKLVYDLETAIRILEHRD